MYSPITHAGRVCWSELAPGWQIGHRGRLRLPSVHPERASVNLTAARLSFGNFSKTALGTLALAARGSDSMNNGGGKKEFAVVWPPQVLPWISLTRERTYARNRASGVT